MSSKQAFDETGRNACPTFGDKDFVSVDLDHQLYDVATALGACRKQLRRLCDDQSGLEKRCLTAEQYSAQCAQAYQYLFYQYQKTVRDLAETASKCGSLQKEVESAQTTIFALESIAQRPERYNADEDLTKQTIEGMGASQAHLEARVAGLEREKTESHDALTRAADVICRLTQKVDDLQSMYRATECQETGESTRVTRSAGVDEKVSPHEVPVKRARRSRKRKCA